MSVVVIGGNARKVGKTSLAAALISALPEFHWTAVKISELHAGECATGTPDCGCSADEHTCAISEEHDRSGGCDTSRFLLAGAKRAFWVRAKPGRLADAMPELKKHLTGGGNVMLESSSVLEFLRPDVYLMVLDFSNPDFKESAHRFLERADAFVVASAGNAGNPPWKNSLQALLQTRPSFSASPPTYATAELVAWLRLRLESRIAYADPSAAR